MFSFGGRMHTRIAGDKYDTPEGIKPALREFLLFKSRWSPYSFFFGVTLRYRALAVKGTYSDEAWSDSSLEVLHKLELCGAKFHISGLDKLRNMDGPAVFVSNHMSTFEAMILPGLINPIKPCTFVVKEKLMRGLIWGPVMRSRNPIPVTRKDPRADLEAVLNGGAERLANKRSIIIFPQGTRKEIFTRAGFNSLGAKLAARAGVPLVPIALKTDYWGNSPVLRGFGPVYRDRAVMIEFGDPIEANGKSKSAHESSLDFIESRLKAWGAKVE